MDRQHRHDLKHDKFVDEIGELSSKARDNQRLLYTIGGVAIAIALVVYGIFFYRSNKEENGQEALALAIETFEAPVGDQPQQQPATAGPKFKTEAERTAASEKAFNDVRSKYSGTDAGDVAGLYLARLAMTKNDVKAARTHLEQFIDSQKGHILADGARFSLYQLRIDNGEAAQVAVELNAELAKAEPVLPGDSLLVLLAQAYEIQGDGARSREAYRRLAAEFPESPYAIDAQRRVGA
jgi:predicted negative regulator of RcsB-dependent stress response